MLHLFAIFNSSPYSNTAIIAHGDRAGYLRVTVSYLFSFLQCIPELLLNLSTLVSQKANRSAVLSHERSYLIWGDAQRDNFFGNSLPTTERCQWRGSQRASSYQTSKGAIIRRFRIKVIVGDIRIIR
ncbi:hypothetical protein CEXT_631161 [Caerostris extrusa]|uniref:Uncharacterized protein n=1 Tax=Caerostris extrusa TaxID=172846 RepID=A0AAV4SEF9_CAEEX|nr:hypothetical protein CEXT_631161 [Caerostris extrusa]